MASQGRNPYISSATKLSGEEMLHQRDVSIESMQSLWLAYLIAPIVVPISFVLLLFLVVLASAVFGFEINTASGLVLPIFLMTVGVVLSYLLWGVVGMPIILFLQRKNRLSAFNIHVTALTMPLLMALLVGYWVISRGSAGVAVTGFELAVRLASAFFFMLVLFGIPALLSSSAFWFLAKRFELRRKRRVP